MDNIYSDFAYDDAFRTMESECDDILIPFVNYFHNEHYDDSAKIIRGRNEHFIEYPDHSEDKRTVDSSFGIEYHNHMRNYHYECESSRYGDSLLIRMFEYDAQIALDQATVNRHHLRVEFPYSGILLLRGKDTFSEATVEITTPGGSLKYPLAIKHMSGLSIDDLFEKHLYMLLPFYIFNVEGRLDIIDREPGELKHFSELYTNILQRLESEMEKDHLSQFSYGVIISLIHKVAYKITMKRGNIQEKVGDIMGGKVLDLDIIRARHQGRAEGWAEGRAEGKAEGKAEGRAEGKAEGKAEGRAEERENNIRKLAGSYMEQNSTLSEETALEMARAILG